MRTRPNLAPSRRQPATLFSTIPSCSYFLVRLSCELATVDRARMQLGLDWSWAGPELPGDPSGSLRPVSLLPARSSLSLGAEGTGGMRRVLVRQPRLQLAGRAEMQAGSFWSPKQSKGGSWSCPASLGMEEVRELSASPPTVTPAREGQKRTKARRQDPEEAKPRMPPGVPEIAADRTRSRAREVTHRRSEVEGGTMHSGQAVLAGTLSREAGRADWAAMRASLLLFRPAGAASPPPARAEERAMRLRSAAVAAMGSSVVLEEWLTLSRLPGTAGVPPHPFGPAAAERQT